MTGVCGTANLELVRPLGADQVVDYTADDFTTRGQAYDIVFDAVGKSSFSRCKRALKQSGVFLTTVPTLTTMLQIIWTAMTGGRQVRFGAMGSRPASKKREELNTLRKIIEAGGLKAVIDSRYPQA